MTQNPRFAIQILEKIGAPLAAAIELSPPDGDDQGVESAKVIAQMLGQAVQVSISLSTALDLKESEEQADTTRVALAALAAPLIASFYEKNTRVPEEQDIKRMTKSLESVLVFAENFTAASNEASRLSTIDHSNPLFDEAQVLLVMLQAMTPVIAAVSEFPFGMSETKLVQDVSEKLQKDAAEIAAGSGNGKLGEIMVFKSLANIYANCHLFETSRLLGNSEESRDNLSIEPVWDHYEMKIEMVKALAGFDMAGQAGAGGFGVAPMPEEQPAEAPEPPPLEPATAPESPPAQPQPSEPPPQPAQAPASGGPMGFFAKKDTAEAPPLEPEQAPAAETPPEQLAPAPQEPPPQPPEQPPAEPPPAKENPPQPASPPASGDGGPMSFFKPGSKPADDGTEGA